MTVEYATPRTVHKFTLCIGGEDKFDLDAAARVVHVAMQNGMLRIWVERTPGAAPLARTFGVFGTGHQLPRGWEHVGSCLDGDCVWHVYEQRAAP